MSSEVFENYESEFNNIITSINKKINSQIPNYTGEQRKACIRAANKEIERGEDLLVEMDQETRSAPPTYRTKMTTRLRSYQADLQKMKKDLSNLSAGASFADDKAALLSSSSTFEEQNFNQRSRLLKDTDTLNRTSEHLRNAQRIGEESEQIGAGVLTELDTQRQTIKRVGTKVQNTDANLGKSRRILNSMSRRVMTNKLLMFCIIFVLLGILGIEVYFKFFH